MSKVGDSIWVKEDRRVYREDENGKRYGAPIEREKWVEHKIINETSQSFIIDSWGTKIPKKKEKQFGVAFSEQEVNQLVYVEENRYRIAEALRKANYAQLKAVADIIGYEAEDEH